MEYIQGNDDGIASLKCDVFIFAELTKWKQNEQLVSLFDWLVVNAVLAISNGNGIFNLWLFFGRFFFIAPPNRFAYRIVAHYPSWWRWWYWMVAMNNFIYPTIQLLLWPWWYCAVCCAAISRCICARLMVCCVWVCFFLVSFILEPPN